MIMPIVFSIVFVCAIGLYSLIFFLLHIPIFVKVIIAFVIIGFAIVMVYLLIQRNKELKEEEENDFSKY